MKKRTSSKDSNRQTSCDGKQALSVAGAKRAASRMGLAPYRCNHCGMWHIGQPNKLNVKLVDKRKRFIILDEPQPFGKANDVKCMGD